MASERKARRYAVVSGKGGVGKTVITANLAAAVATSGRRTLVVDADLGLANLDVILGICPTSTLRDVLGGDRGIDEVITPTAAGFALLPAGSGIQEGTILTPALAESLESALRKLETRYDCIFFDAGAGIGEVVMFFASISDRVLLVVTPEPTSVMDAYATIKVLASRYGKRDVWLIVNQANPANPIQSGIAVTNHLRRVASQFLTVENAKPVRIQLLGSIPADPSVGRAIQQQELLSRTAPKSPATHGISNLAESLGLLAAKPSPIGS